MGSFIYMWLNIFQYFSSAQGLIEALKPTSDPIRIVGGIGEREERKQSVYSHGQQCVEKCEKAWGFLMESMHGQPVEKRMHAARVDGGSVKGCDNLVSAARTCREGSSGDISSTYLCRGMRNPNCFSRVPRGSEMYSPHQAFASRTAMLFACSHVVFPPNTTMWSNQLACFTSTSRVRRWRKSYAAPTLAARSRRWRSGG